MLTVWDKFVMRVCGELVPPEADREADIDGPDVVPAAWRDVESLSRV